ncbi:MULTISPECIES: hypothetical protein [unclassified Mesorhizobium]|uniref:hypothetical protein n=1 Tax=unclassified Mesorhizobium TaxID=325217 RepID=UPI00167C0FE8|nr:MULTISPECIES: hypothetical protein [unclassified Mesorhizobium]
MLFPLPGVISAAADAPVRKKPHNANAVKSLVIIIPPEGRILEQFGCHYAGDLRRLGRVLRAERFLADTLAILATGVCDLPHEVTRRLCF